MPVIDTCFEQIARSLVGASQFAEQVQFPGRIEGCAGGRTALVQSALIDAGARFAHAAAYLRQPVGNAAVQRGASLGNARQSLIEGRAVCLCQTQQGCQCRVIELLPPILQPDHRRAMRQRRMPLAGNRHRRQLVVRS